MMRRKLDELEVRLGLKREVTQEDQFNDALSRLRVAAAMRDEPKIALLSHNLDAMATVWKVEGAAGRILEAQEYGEDLIEVVRDEVIRRKVRDAKQEQRQASP